MSKPPREKIDIPFTSDAELDEMVTAFEGCRWPYPRWTHRAHIGVAVAYLSRLPFDTALTRARHHINLYNRTCGDPDGYHETITVLHMRRVAHYLAEQIEPLSLAAALDAVAVLCARGWTARYYSPQRLGSAEAKAGWVEPDLEPLDF